MKREKERAIERLKKYDLANSCVVVNITRVNRMNSVRYMKFYIPEKYNDKIRLSWLDYDISTLLEYKNTVHGLRVSGGGMDMVFHVLDHLKHELKLDTDRDIEYQLV
tara:strand:- start:299 stop:619 length:321 start_codon:yes stop_codon:yes gene_type:complete